MASCGAGGENREGGEAAVPEPQPRSLGQSVSPTDSITVVFHLTGLLMLVPPSQGNASTQVLIPHATGHHARLGFGGDSTSVCRQYLAGICYVDLDTFTVHPLGAGGGPSGPPTFGLASHSANVTRGSGGQYRVHLPSIQSHLRSRVVFQSGGLTGKTCSLARWSFTPVDSAGNPDTTILVDLPNVVSWAISHPASETFRLRIQRQGQAPIDVPLRGIVNDSIHVVLANVPGDELDDLPPAPPQPATGTPPATLRHYHDFYNLLRKPGQNDSPPPSHRPLPRFDSTREPMCPVRISTVVMDTVIGEPRGTLEEWGVKTYGCVVGSGEG